MPKPNLSPTVILKVTGDFFVGSLITIDASESFDPDGIIKRVEYHTGDGEIFTSRWPGIVNYKYDEPGDYEIIVTARDNNKNIGSMKVTIGILRIGGVVQPPVEYSVDNQAVSVDSSDGNPVVVTYPDPPDLNNGTAPFDVQYSTPDGSSFPVGVTTVTMVVTDANGNSASGNLIVTVNNTSVAPDNLVVTAPADIEGDSLDGNPLSLTFGNPTITGGTAPYTTVFTLNGTEITSPYDFPVGTSTILITVTDSLSVVQTAHFTAVVNPPVPTPPPPPPPTDPPIADPEDYDSLIAHPNFYKGFSLRPRVGAPITSPYYEKQLLRPGLGGYRASNDPATPSYMIYDPTHDTDSHKQDAMKLFIPGFSRYNGLGGDYEKGGFILQAPLGVADTTIPCPQITGSFSPWVQKAFLSESGEIIKITAIDTVNKIFTVTRANFGSIASTYPAGAIFGTNYNTIPVNIRLPIGTQDGHSYLFIYYFYLTDSFLNTGLTNHKAQNLISNGIWFEPDFSYQGGTGAAKIAGFDKNTYIAAFQVRSYNIITGGAGPYPSGTDPKGYCGPGVTDNEPLSPQINTFAILPNVWNKVFIHLQQRAGDYDLVSTWIADETRGPILIHNQLPLSIRESVDSVSELVMEFNTSTQACTRGNRMLVGYMKNVAVMKDLSDITPFLVKPRTTV